MLSDADRFHDPSRFTAQFYRSVDVSTDTKAANVIQDEDSAVSQSARHMIGRPRACPEFRIESGNAAYPAARQNAFHANCVRRPSDKQLDITCWADYRLG